MVRNVLGSLIALVGATAAVWSPFRPWYDGRHGSDVRIEDLFNGITANGAALFGSVLLPMAFAALLTLIGVALRSRTLVALAGLVVLGFTILWMVRQGQAASELTAGARGLGVGVANALGGGALMLLGALIMRGRGRRVYDRGYEDGYGHGYDRRYDERPYDDRQYDDGSYGHYRPDDRYDARTPYPPAVPEPWDAGRPGAEEWYPEPYATGEDDTPTTPLPVTPPPPTQQQPQPPQPQRPQQPAPTRPAYRRQPPTPPVEWGKEYRQPRPHKPTQPQQPQPSRTQQAPETQQTPEKQQAPEAQEPEQPPEDRQ
ncbi:hypothetical protein [Streptomyces inhibens]|uniref:hypothetical protein n=1 Tax=Streptomyces inhibens TaxID=2293571 RepID=UPI003CCA1FE4